VFLSRYKHTKAIRRDENLFSFVIQALYANKKELEDQWRYPMELSMTNYQKAHPELPKNKKK
jgi:hypothetical protein